MPTSDVTNFLNFSTTLLRLFFVGLVLGFLGSFSFQTDILPIMIFLEMLLGLLQWLHALYVGYRIGSTWHQRYFKFATGYLVVGGLLFAVAGTSGEFGFMIVLLLGGGLVVPMIMAGVYTLIQHNYLPVAPSSREVDEDILDDTFYQ